MTSGAVSERATSGSIALLRCPGESSSTGFSPLDREFGPSRSSIAAVSRCVEAKGVSGDPELDAHVTVADAGYEIRCNDCGALVSSTAETCSACGTVLLGAAAAPPQPELLTPAPTAASSATPSDLWALAAATAPRYEPGHWGFGGFWIRVLAAFFDYFVTLAAVTAARLSFGLIGLLAVLPLVLTYYPLMEASPWQATLGK